MKKIIIGFFVFLMFVVLGLAIFVFTFDINSYKSRIEKAISDATGYTFVINGKIKTTRSFEPIVYVEGIEVKAAKGFEKEPLLVAKRAIIKLDLKSLLKDIVVVHDINLHDVTLRLKVNKNGSVNWLAAVKEKLKNTARPSLKKQPQQKKQEKNVSIALLSAEKMNVFYQNDMTGDSFNLFFPKISIQQLFNFSGDVIFHEKKLTFTGTIHNLVEVLKNQKSLNFSFDISSDLWKSKVSGVCRDLTSCRSDLTLNLDFSGKNFNDAYTFITQKSNSVLQKSFAGKTNIRIEKTSLLTEGKFNLAEEAVALSYNIEYDLMTKSGKGRVELNISDEALTHQYGIEPFSIKTNYTSDKGSIFEFSNIIAMFNETDIDGSIHLDLTQTKPNVTMQLHSHYFKLSNVLYSGEKSEQKVVKQTNQKVFSDEKIDFSVLNKLNATASVVIDNLSVDNWLARYPQVNLNATLTDGLLNADLAEGTFIANGLAVGHFVLQADSLPVFAQASLVVQGLEFSQIVPWKKVLRSGDVNTNLFLKTQGDSLSSLLANLNGSVLILANQIDIISPVIRELSVGDSHFNSSRISEELFIKCGVLNTKISDGIVHFDKTMGVETNKFNLTVDGNINLKDESFSLELIPYINKTDNAVHSVTKVVIFDGSFLMPKSRVTEKESSELKKLIPSKKLQSSENKKGSHEDNPNAVCRIAMGETVFKDVDAYFGRKKAIIPEKKEEPVEQKEEMSKVEMVGRDLINSLSDALSEEDKKGLSVK